MQDNEKFYGNTLLRDSFLKLASKSYKLSTMRQEELFNLLKAVRDRAYKMGSSEIMREIQKK